MPEGIFSRWDAYEFQFRIAIFGAGVRSDSAASECTAIFRSQTPVKKEPSGLTKP
jgi:hypothetical protein